MFFQFLEKIVEPLRNLRCYKLIIILLEFAPDFRIATKRVCCGGIPPLPTILTPIFIFHAAHNVAFHPLPTGNPVDLKGNDYHKKNVPTCGTFFFRSR